MARARAKLTSARLSPRQAAGTWVTVRCSSMARTPNAVHACTDPLAGAGRLVAHPAASSTASPVAATAAALTSTFIVSPGRPAGRCRPGGPAGRRPARRPPTRYRQRKPGRPPPHFPEIVRYATMEPNAILVAELPTEPTLRWSRGHRRASRYDRHRSVRHRVLGPAAGPAARRVRRTARPAHAAVLRRAGDAVPEPR